MLERLGGKGVGRRAREVEKILIYKPNLSVYYKYRKVKSAIWQEFLDWGFWVPMGCMDGFPEMGKLFEIACKILCVHFWGREDL